MDLPAQDFWLTRDRSEGDLATDIEVWLCRPDPIFYTDGDVTWIAPLGLVDRGPSYLGTITVEFAASELGNGIPASERECVHVARTPCAKV